MIPKIIHQIWIPIKENDLPPDNWISQMKTWQKLEGYEYMFWSYETINNLFKNHYPQFIEIFNSYEHDIQRLDVSRYFILYHYGGIYVDLDIGIVKEPPFFSKYDLVLARSPNYPNIINAIMGCSKNNEYFRNCINNLNRNFGKYRFSKHFNVMYSSGPCYITKIFKENEPEEYYLMSKSDLSLVDVSEDPNNVGKYFRHVEGGQTWCGKDSKFIFKAFKLYKKISIKS